MNNPRYVLARADGEPMQGEYSYYTTDDPNDFDGADAEIDGSDDPIEFVILEVNPEPVNRRTLYPFQWCKTHNQSQMICEDEDLEGECEDA